MSLHGWAGKILDVNLTTSKIKGIATDPSALKYLGGRGLASRIYWETVGPAVRAFDPENHLIFMAGTLVATGAQGATRLSVVGKSPMALPEGYCYGNMGGYFSAELKKAGFDGIVISGRAPKPVYLLINDNEAELRDASFLWGHGAYRTGELIEEAHGKKVCFATTGVAGENRVRTAVIYASNRATATGGFGAVMGSKNFKAIAVRGTGKPTVADPDRLKELNRYTIKISKRIKWPAPPIIEGTNHAHLVEEIGKDRCYQCVLECPKAVYRYGKKLEGNRRCQSMEYYLPWRFDREDEPIETFFDAPTLANDYSIGTFELQSIIDWLYACHRAGALTEEETGLPLSKIGTREFLEKLLHSIAHREGFGNILAEGLVRAREKISPKARALFSNNVAPIGQHDICPPRAIIAHALLYPMEPRMHPISLHEIIYIYMAWRMNRADPATSPVTSKVLLDIAKAFWGSEEAGDLSSYEGKAMAARNIQNRTYIKDSLGLCDFVWPITYSFNTPDHVGDPNLEANLFSAVTGINAGEIPLYAERIFTMQRAILVREGWNVLKTDFPPEFNFTEPLAPYVHGTMQVPGLSGEVVDTTGMVLNREKYKDLLKEYYRLRGWDEATGLPRAETLAALGIDDLAAAFQHQESR
jgi:aldehyde:ferredoxin oxidoreductase